MCLHAVAGVTPKRDRRSSRTGRLWRGELPHEIRALRSGTDDEGHVATGQDESRPEREVALDQLRIVDPGHAGPLPRLPARFRQAAIGIADARIAEVAVYAHL